MLKYTYPYLYRVLEVIIIKVFIYLRKSRKDIEDERSAKVSYDTLERHRTQLLAYAKKNKYVVIEIFEEIVSGEYISERPEMQRLLRSVEKRSVDGVLVMDVDRLGRGDMLDQGLIYRSFRTSNTLIISPTEIIDPADDTHEITYSVKSLVAREELKQINKRLMRGRKASASEGKHVGKNAPLGYLKDSELRLVIDPEKSWIIEYIFQQILNGFGMAVICKKLNNMNIQSATGKQWQPIMVRAIAKNRVYCGDIIFQNKQHKKINGKYKVTQNPNPIVVENAHEGIITRETYFKAQEVMLLRSNSTNSDKKVTNALAGVLRCKLCGRSIYLFKSVHGLKRGLKSALQLGCKSTECKTNKLTRTTRYDLVEDAVLAALEQFISNFDISNKGSEKELDTTSIEIALRENKKQIEELEVQKENLYTFLEKGVYSIDIFTQRQLKLSEKEEELKNINRSLNIELETILNSSVNKIIPKLKNVVEAYRSTNDNELKNKLMKSVISYGTLYRSPDSTDATEFELQIYPRL
jgi:DNA invertase Pin-like site-specific DNA recombinase